MGQTGSQLGQIGSNMGLKWVTRVAGSSQAGQVGHVGLVGHWAGELSEMAFGATGFYGQVFWATSLYNGYLGL